MSDSNIPPISPREAKKMYEAEYKHAADLFQRSLKEYAKSDNMFQKAAFKNVMEESLEVLKDAATELKRQDLLNQNSKIEQDFAAFEEDESARSNLMQDLDQAKRSV